MTTVTVPVRRDYSINSTYVVVGEPTVYKQQVVHGSLLFGKSNRRVTNQNPNWRVQVAKKADATTAYERTSFKYRPMTSRATSFGIKQSTPVRKYYEGTIVHDYPFDPSVIIDSSDDLSLRSRASERLSRRLATQTSQMNALVPLAELREMRGLITSIARSSVDLFIALGKARKTKGKSVYQYASDIWLTYSFGIKPTLNDINALSKSIDEIINGYDRTVRVSATASKQWSSRVAPLQGVVNLFGAQHNRFITADHTLSYRYVSGFDIQLRSGNNYGISDELGLDFGALIPTFWELVPYSWVVDYFTNVGAYLDDTFISPPGNTKFVSLNKRYTCIIKVDGKFTPATSSDNVTSQFCRKGYASYFHFTRTPLGTSFPRPSLRIRSADEIGANAVNKLLNLASVFIQGRR